MVEVRDDDLDNRHGWPAMVPASAGALLFWGLIIAGVVLPVRPFGRAAPPAAHPGGPATPRQVLGERFARGEIDEDEYTRRPAP